MAGSLPAVPLTLEEAIHEATQRFLTDPLFHARVEVCLRALDTDLYRGTGQHMNSEDRSLAALAAGLGILLADRDPTTGLPWR